MFVRSLRAVSQLLLFQVILLTFVQTNEAASNSSSDLNDESVLNDLRTGKRQILAIGRMVHSMDNKIVMMVAQLDDSGKPTQWDDIYVYNNVEQVSKGMVLNGGQMLKTKWPVLHEKLTKFEGNQLYTIFTISDSKIDYVMMFMKYDFFVYNINEGKLDKYDNEFIGDYTGISRSELYSCYGTKGLNAQLVLIDFYGNKPILTDRHFLIGNSITICKADASDELSINQDCKSGPMNWQIRTGFVDDKFAHLIDKQGTVYKFDAAALDNSSAKLETIKPSELFGSAKNGNDSKSNSVGGLSTGAIVAIVVVVIVIILVVVAVAGYCLCCSGKRSPKQRSKPKSSGRRRKSSKIKGSKIKGSKVASAKKSSKIASRVRSKRRSSALANKPASGRKMASSRATSCRSTKPNSARKVSSRR